MDFSLITSEPDAYRAGGLFLKIDSYSMIFMMLEITTQGVFYGTGRTGCPRLWSASPATCCASSGFALGHWGWGSGVWWAVSMSSILKGCCLVRLVGFASSRALDRQYVETPFRPAILTKCASFRGWRSIR